MSARAAGLAGALLLLAGPWLFAQGPAPPPAPVHAAPAPDPGPDGWGPYAPPSPPPGWFVDAEVALVFPALKFAPINEVPLGPGSGLLRIPKVGLSTTVTPTFEAGYHLPDSAGLLALNYRFLVSEGTGGAATPDGALQIRTRLDTNVVTLDYGTAPYEFLPCWPLSFRIGLQLGDAFFDSRGVRPGLLEQASNTFIGAGPHARIELEHPIQEVPGLSVFGRLDGAVLWGQVNQHFRVEVDPLGVTTTEQRRPQVVPVLNTQAGLSYCPPTLPGLRLSAGYTFERWWYVGELGLNSQGTLALPALATAINPASPAVVPLTPSRGEFWLQGLFLRAQYDF